MDLTSLINRQPVKDMGKAPEHFVAGVRRALRDAGLNPEEVRSIHIENGGAVVESKDGTRRRWTA